MSDKSDLTITKLMNYIHTRKKGEIGFVDTKIGGNFTKKYGDCSWKEI